MNLCWCYGCIAYMIPFWRLSFHNDQDIAEFWCGGEVSVCVYFSKVFFKNSKKILFLLGVLRAFFGDCDPMC